MTSEGRKYGRLVEYSVVFIMLLILIGLALYYAIYVGQMIPLSSATAVELIIAAALGFLIIVFIGRELSSVAIKLLGKRHGSMVLVIYRFVAYIVLGLVLLAIVGVSGTALLAGGTFAGLVLGLAAQTVLSNIIAGIMIVLARPYEVEDRVTFFTWQYGLIAPAYPPKFYSNDFLIPGYSGTIKDIGLTYTLVKLDDAPLMKVPNSIMVQAAFICHGVSERLVRTKYEVPASIDPERVIDRVVETVRKNEWVTDPDSVHVMVNAATTTIYVVAVDALCKGSYEEPARSAVLLDLMRIVKDLKSAGVDTGTDTKGQGN